MAVYVGQLYSAGIGIVTLPLCLKYMGAEAYGLVGFYAMLQTWFSLLDLGLSQTISRETARFVGGATPAPDYLLLVRILETIFAVLGVVGCAVLYASAGSVAVGWLKPTSLSAGEVRGAIELMSFIVAARWTTGLYRGVLIGFERQGWLAAFIGGVATLRFVAVLPVLAFVDASAHTFFRFQAGVAAVELIGMVAAAYRVLPAGHAERPWSAASRERLAPVLRFALGVAFSTSVWVLVTQTDKLVLSRILQLADFGYFSLAVLVASGVTMVSAPMSMVLMPRLARLEAEGRPDELVRSYRFATQCVAVSAGAVAVVLAVCAGPLLAAWTGDARVAAAAAPVLALYAAGNGLLAVNAFAFYLQYAKGDLRFHVYGSAAFVLLLVPAAVWAANRYGAVGAGWVWLVLNGCSFVLWVSPVHRRFAPGLNGPWYSQDTLAIFAAAAAGALFADWALPVAADRTWMLVRIAAVAGVAAGAAFGAASLVRGPVLDRIRGALA